MISNTVTCPQMERFVKFCPGTVQKGLGRDRTTLAGGDLCESGESTEEMVEGSLVDEHGGILPLKKRDV